MTRTALYRFFNADGVLLYVGITENTATRWASHKATKEWWPAVVHKEVEWHGSREVAEEAERQALGTEEPLYNVRDVPGRAPARRDPAVETTEFWQYVMRVTGNQTPSQIARQMGDIAITTVASWRDVTPKIESALRFARTYGVNPIEGYVAAGFLTAEDASMRTVSSLALVSSAELGAEVKRRLTRRDSAAA